LKLAEELNGWNDEDGRRWSQNLKPLADALAGKYLSFLPKQTYPIRTGVQHSLSITRVLPAMKNLPHCWRSAAGLTLATTLVIRPPGNQVVKTFSLRR
jgi:hypothetical protein